MKRLLPALADLPLLAAAAYMLVLLAQTVAPRLLYPFDLEWMEGGMLLHATRVLDGQPIYVEPSADFIPFIYPPLYPWVVAAVSALSSLVGAGGLSYAIGRGVSLAGTLLAAAALVPAVRAERGGTALGLGAAALYLSCYDESGSFYDLVRNDGLLMGLLAWSLVAIRTGRLRSGGLLLALAFAAKHNAAVLGLPAFVWLWRYRSLRDALRFLGWSAGPAIAFVLALQLATDGLFLVYILGVPASHPFVPGRFIPGTPRELFRAMPWTVGAALFAGLLHGARSVVTRVRLDEGAAYWGSLALTAVLLCAAMRGHHGGYVNVLMPAHWLLAMGGALAVVGAQALVPEAGWAATGVRALGAILVAGTVWSGRWTPSRWAPTDEDLAAGRRVVQRLALVQGEILSPQSPYLPVLAGKESAVALIALWDVDHRRSPLRQHVRAIDESIAEKRWAAVLVADERFGHGLKEHYRKAEEVTPPGKALMPKTGWKVKPRYLYVPREE